MKKYFSAAQEAASHEKIYFFHFLGHFLFLNKNTFHWAAFCLPVQYRVEHCRWVRNANQTKIPRLGVWPKHHHCHLLNVTFFRWGSVSRMICSLQLHCQIATLFCCVSFLRGDSISLLPYFPQCHAVNNTFFCSWLWDFVCEPLLKMLRHLVGVISRKSCDTAITWAII